MNSTAETQAAVSLILNEIEDRIRDAQEKEHDSIWKFRKAVGMSADDVPALLKIVKLWVEELRYHGRGKKISEIVAILNGENQ